jgi:hypothetical protein
LLGPIPFCWAKPTCFDFSLSNFVLMGGPHNEHQWSWRSPLFRHPQLKRSNNYQSVTVSKEWESKKSLCAEVWHMHDLIWRFYEIQVGAFHFSRCQWDRIKIERKLPQTLDIALHIWICIFGFLVADLCVFKVEGKLVDNIEETHLPFSLKWFRSLSVSTLLSMQTQIIATGEWGWGWGGGRERKEWTCKAFSSLPHPFPP